MYEGSAVAFIDSDGRILLHNRKADGKSRFGERWGLIGGRLESGEKMEQALTREISEELGYQINDAEFIDDYKWENPEILIHLFIAPFPGFDQFKKTKEGDIRKNLNLFTFKEAINKSTVGLGYIIYKDLNERGYLK
jgi:8-oxo-dGTP pyrophosphatase MutT (NUDIX family)